MENMISKSLGCHDNKNRLGTSYGAFSVIVELVPNEPKDKTKEM